MDKIKELMSELQEKMNECDELIAEIAQLRYDLEDILAICQSKMPNISKEKTAC